MAVELSIVIPTCNRAALLREALLSIEAGVRSAHEIIVVDGASTDQTPQVLREAGERLGVCLQVIREDTRGGFVRAANRGFRAASGRHLTWLNDDARPLPGALDRAVAQVESSRPGLGFVAMFHRWNSMRNIAYEIVNAGRRYRLCHIRGTLYANFAMGRRETFEQLGYFDEGYYFRGADPDLSLKAWQAGLRIEPAYGAMIDHDETHDPRRSGDDARARQDNERLFAKWDLPAKNPLRNDFDPARPCTLRAPGNAEIARAA